MEDFYNLSSEDLSAYFKKHAEPRYRAQQVFEAVYRRGIRRFEDISSLSNALRSRMSRDFLFGSLKVSQSQVSRDGTAKYLFELSDEEKVETVFIPAARRRTICVSTQVGCKFACRFCASGLNGFVRNLTCAEILLQILSISDLQKKHGPLTHVVYMGTGEPLDNYANVMKSIRLINSPKGLGLAARRITISTCGLVPQIRKMSEEQLQIELSVSLHGYDNASRASLMPVAKKYPFSALVEACRQYAQKTNRQVTFEYLLIKEQTCSEQAAKVLARALKGFLCKVNLIPYNPISEHDYQPPSRSQCFAFRSFLQKHGVHATIRVSRGKDIQAACGQLRNAMKGARSHQ